MPKPPPTSYVRTRSFCGGTLNTPSARRRRTTVTPCVLAISVCRSATGSHWPIAARGSGGERAEPRVEQPHALDVRGAGERGVDHRRVAVGPVEGDDVRRLGPDRLRARRHGVLAVGGGGQLGE